MSRNKVALITGASSGIGRELAVIHAENGGDVIIVARRADKLESLKAELESNHGISVTVIAKDLSATNAAQEIYNEVKTHGLSVDYLINNAGIGIAGYFHDSPLEPQRRMIDVNIWAPTTLIHVFLPDFVKRQSGKIMNVSSTASLIPGGPRMSIYHASKHYLTAFSHGIAEEVREHNISVTALLPGATESEFGNAAQITDTALFNQSTPARVVAEAAYKGMLKGKLEVIAGLTWTQKLLGLFIPLATKSTILKHVHGLQKPGSRKG